MVFFIFFHRCPYDPCSVFALWPYGLLLPFVPMKTDKLLWDVLSVLYCVWFFSLRASSDCHTPAWATSEMCRFLYTLIQPCITVHTGMWGKTYAATTTVNRSVYDPLAHIIAIHYQLTSFFTQRPSARINLKSPIMKICRFNTCIWRGNNVEKNCFPLTWSIIFNLDQAPCVINASDNQPVM